MSISIIFPLDTQQSLVGEKITSFGLSSFADSAPSDAIKQNLKMLLLTRKGEYVMDFNFGVGLQQYLFENSNTIDFSSIESEIRKQVATYMPYTTIESLSVSEGEDETTMNVRIEFFYNEQPTPEVFELEVI